MIFIAVDQDLIIHPCFIAFVAIVPSEYKDGTELTWKRSLNLVIYLEKVDINEKGKALLKLSKHKIVAV